MYISNANKGHILASVSDPDAVHALLDIFDTMAEIIETGDIMSKNLTEARADIAIARDENATLRQRIAELEAADLFGTEAPDND